MNTIEADGRSGLLRDFFLETGVAIRCRKGELILHAEDEVSSAYYIESGFVKVYSLNARGEEYILVVYGPGDFFPLLWLSRAARRSVFYQALAPCSLLKVRFASLEYAIQCNASLARDMLDRALQQHGVFIDRINNLQYRFARERLVYCLLYLGQRFGVAKGTEREIGLRISHQVLASNINLSRESVGRELDRLIRKDMVMMRDGHIVLKNIPRLVAELPGTSVSGDWWGLAEPA